MMAPNGFEASWTARAEKIQLSKKLSKIPVKGSVGAKCKFPSCAANGRRRRQLVQYAAHHMTISS
jgi:hypothetical protein